MKSTFQIATDLVISSEIKHIRSARSCQEIDFISDLFSFDRYDIRLLAALYPYGTDRQAVQVAYDGLALRLGVSSRQAKRLVKRAEQKGYLLVNRTMRDDGTHKNNPNIYSLHSSIDRKILGYQVRDILPSIKSMGLSILLLLSFNLSAMQHVTLLNIKGLEFKKDLLYEKGERVNVHAKLERAAMSKEIPAFHPILEKFPFRLTTWQKVVLMAYPQDAIVYAATTYLARENLIESPLGFVIRLCKRYCQERNIVPQVEYAGDLALALGVSPTNPEPTTGPRQQINNDFVNQLAKKKEAYTPRKFDAEDRSVKVKDKHVSPRAPKCEGLKAGFARTEEKWSSRGKYDGIDTTVLTKETMHFLEFLVGSDSIVFKEVQNIKDDAP